MEKDKTSGSIYHEKTEDFTEILKEIDQDIKEVESDIETLEETKKIITVDNQEDDFVGLIKKRDYKGKEEKNIEVLEEKKKSPKKKLKKWVYVVLLIILLAGGFGTYKIIDNKKIARKKQEEKELVETIKSHYNTYVKVDKDTDLLVKDNNEYQKIGMVYQNTLLELADVDIDINTKYFQIKNLDYYIAYSDISGIDAINSDNRYRKYLPFNINIITKDSFTMYDKDNKMITINKEMEFPVLINNYDGKYYVEYNNHLVNINKDDISKTVEHNNTTKKNQPRITTLAYHRVYDTTDTCTDPYVCLKKETFDKQMKYLKDNDYFTLTLDELYMYLKGNLQIEKGVVITIDDGYLFNATDEVLSKYGLNGTMFVISGDFKDYSIFENLDAITIQSHTHKMHKNYVCAGGNQGGAILCAGKDNIVEDLKMSLAALKVDPIGLAFPFYDYNTEAINALKEAGFKMAFIGRAGVMGKATLNVTDMYKIPRMTVWEESLMSFNQWKSYL